MKISVKLSSFLLKSSQNFSLINETWVEKLMLVNIFEDFPGYLWQTQEAGDYQEMNFLGSCGDLSMP